MKTEKNAKFLEMLEAVLLKRINDIKHLGIKDVFPLEDWEQLFDKVREYKEVATKSKNTMTDLSLLALGDIIDVDINTLFISGSGVEDDGKNGKAREFLCVKGHPRDVMSTLAFNMMKDEDTESLIAGAIFLFDKFREASADNGLVEIHKEEEHYENNQI